MAPAGGDGRALPTSTTPRRAPPARRPPGRPTPRDRTGGRTMSRDHESTVAPGPGPLRTDAGPEQALVQQGIITDEEYASALSRSEQSGHSIWTALRGLSLIGAHQATPGDGAGA